VPVTWGEFASAHPGLADFGAERLTGAPAYLATVRPTGAPRVHPVTPIISANHLFLFMEPTSPKGKDLLSRTSYMLHNGVPDMNGTGGEFHVSGTADLLDDPASRAEAAEAAAYDPVDRYLLFELRVAEARGNGYGDVTLPDPPRWRAP
jgi:hypothetical protein